MFECFFDIVETFFWQTYVLLTVTFQSLHQFILAVGCTNMIPPENAWLRRSNDDIIIGCYSSQHTWQLKCDGREWKGLVGTCPELCESS